MITWILVIAVIILYLGNLARASREKVLERELSLLYLNQDILFEQASRVNGRPLTRHLGSRFETQEYL